MPSITINGVTLDPQAQAPAVRALNLHSADASESNYILLQARAPLTRAERADLEAKGAKILEYVPESTYLCHYPPSDLSAMRSLPFVEWANVYLRGFKIAPALLGASARRGSADLTALALRGAPRAARELKKVDVVFHANVDVDAVRRKVASAAGLDPDDLRPSGNKVRIKVKLERLDELAKIDEVRHIEEVKPAKLHNDVARRILRIETAAQPTPRFEGAGQVIAVCDTGFDRGSSTDAHPAFEGRVARLYALGRPNRTNDPDGHGTHVAGSVLGDGGSVALGHRVRGTAPRARLVLQSVLDSSGGLGGIPDDLGELLQQPYANDAARIHTNSWGIIQSAGQYNSAARELDDFVWRNRDGIVCFAAGNDGRDAEGNGRVDNGSVTPPGTAKNCITVGASENLRPDITETYGGWWPDDFPANPVRTDTMTDDEEGMVAFSGRGPTADGRIKPDLVAPGTFILSTRSRAASDSGWRASADPLYYFLGGTSMATPLVAGCVAVVREYLATERGLTKPSAALVKALLVNGARNLDGQYTPSESGRVPNNAEGFGLVDVSAVVGPHPAGRQFVLKDEGAALDAGEQEVTNFAVARAGTDLKVTLAWTDPPGEALQNDLDLIVRAADGRERHGNVAPNSRKFDRLNNVEQLVWLNLPLGNVQIIVRAWRITQFSQSYALVVRAS